jgi:hypothetical protein
VGDPLQQLMMPRGEPPVPEEPQDIAEDQGERLPQVTDPPLLVTPSSSSSFNTIFVQLPELENLIALVEDSMPFTTDSADVDPDDVRLQDPTLHREFRPNSDAYMSRALRPWEMDPQPRRIATQHASPTNEDAWWSCAQEPRSSRTRPH